MDPVGITWTLQTTLYTDSRRTFFSNHKASSDRNSKAYETNYNVIWGQPFFVLRGVLALNYPWSYLCALATKLLSYRNSRSGVEAGDNLVSVNLYLDDITRTCADYHKLRHT